ncbi:MAG: protein-export chaperone SecB, partial [Beijerinckiaceae bacterium]
IFRLDNIPQEHVHPAVMNECPRLLFPFARQIVAEAVSNGGFPPFLLNPVDFVQLYQQRVLEAQQAEAQGKMTN